jgi:hypothetical protein
MTAPIEKPCKDCITEGITTQRKLARNANGDLQPGPRCVTHHRAIKRWRKQRSHELRVEATYGISGEDYRALYSSQEGRCFICKVARGISRKLAVDHDHTKGCGHDPKMGCRNCVRALLCGPCNQAIGRLSPQALARAITVLTNPPAQYVLNQKGRS